MTRYGFIVEGECEQLLVEYDNFRAWATKHGFEICEPVISVNGGGNLCPHNIEAFIKTCRNLAHPDKIVLLTDLECEPCVTATKDRIGNEGLCIVNLLLTNTHQF